MLTPRRGAILDREGQPLAISADAKTIFAMRQSIKDPKAVAALLARYLGGAGVQVPRPSSPRSGASSTSSARSPWSAPCRS